MFTTNLHVHAHTSRKDAFQSVSFFLNQFLSSIIDWDSWTKWFHLASPSESRPRNLHSTRPWHLLPALSYPHFSHSVFLRCSLGLWKLSRLTTWLEPKPRNPGKPTPALASRARACDPGLPSHCCMTFSAWCWNVSVSVRAHENIHSSFFSTWFAGFWIYSDF